jgi:hypothetical protein
VFGEDPQRFALFGDHALSDAADALADSTVQLGLPSMDGRG